MVDNNGAFFILTLFAVSGILWSGKAAEEDVRKPYIVHTVKSMKPHHFNLHHHWYASMLNNVSGSDPTAKANELLYTYDTLLHGFAARLTKSEAEAMEDMDGCLAVIPSSLNQVATTHTPEFLGLSSSSSPGLWSEYNTYGEDIIIGVVDSGIWPESKSFSDEGLGPVPLRWKGICESGREFNSSHCNSKIIGARYFYKGFESNKSRINETSEFMSPRDAHGHGTHVASIAAGDAVTDASLLGLANGTARGTAPRARLAIYKACWGPLANCDDSDVAAAMEQAVADGVDIISISIHSGDVPFHESHRAIAAFGATERGVFVSTAAGNQGLYALSNTAPWMTTVGASSIDRDFPASIVLGNRQIVRGTSIFKGEGKLRGPLPLVYDSTSNSSKRCLDGSLDPNIVKGKIVLCDQLSYPFPNYDPEESSISAKETEVGRAGGAGVVLRNGDFLGGEQMLLSMDGLPGISVSFSEGEKIKSYIINSSTLSNATAAMRLPGLTVVGKAATTPAPAVAAFSSRGPSIAYPFVLKPDIVAPGVYILAAHLGGPEDYGIRSGTSMACPHISGIAALIKTIHPTWSPAAIKSALMTSSSTLDNKGKPIADSSTMQPAFAIDMGAGHVNPRAALHPGLVYDMGPQDYIDFLCSLNYTTHQIALLTKKFISCSNSTSQDPGVLNYPSFSVVFQPGDNSTKVNTRTVTNVGTEGNVAYRVSVKSPPGVNISVEPQTLVFKKLNDKASYSVRFESNRTGPSASEGEEYDSGEIRWSRDGGGRSTQVVRSPVAFTWQGSN